MTPSEIAKPAKTQLAKWPLANRPQTGLLSCSQSSTDKHLMYTVRALPKCMMVSSKWQKLTDSLLGHFLGLFQVDASGLSATPE